MRFLPTMTAPLAALLLVPACASNAPETRTRGWLGGAFVPVVGSAPLIGSGPHLAPERIVGIPASAEADRGALVTWLDAETPLAAAGLRAGDLVLTVDGAPVGDGDDVREAAEGLAPGAAVPVRYWRDGASYDAAVTVGTESWLRQGMVRIGLGLRSHLDLWPFDDGIDVLGLVVARTFDGVEPSGPGAAYLRAAFPEQAMPSRTLRGWEVFVLPIGFGGTESVTSQTTAVPAE